jgi:excisionase family DNA binding protein
MQTSERLTYNVREAAELLGLSKNSAYQACLRGEIPHLKIGKRILIPKAQLERLLLGNSEAANGER